MHKYFRRYMSCVPLVLNHLDIPLVGHAEGAWHLAIEIL
jgi:hypothetical protein